MSRKAADTGAVKSGKFSSAPTQREDMCKRLVEEDADWCASGGKIWVRCWESPDMFRLVEADVVWESPLMRKS